MAGVRGINPPVVNPRGIPNNPELSTPVLDALTLMISDHSTQSYFSSRHITTEAAKMLVSENRAQYTSKDKNRVTDPNYHTYSWLTKDELIEVRRHFLLENIHFDCSEYKGKKLHDAEEKIRNSSPVELMRCVFPSIEYPTLNATIASMIAIENSCDEYKTRLVFCFDS